MNLMEKYGKFFKASKNHSLSEILAAKTVMNQKYHEVKEFLDRNWKYIPWYREYSPNGDLRNLSLRDEVLVFYPKSLQVKVIETGEYPLNNMHLFVVRNGEIEFRNGLDLNSIDPNSIDFEFEQDQDTFNRWYDSVNHLLDEVIK